MSTYSDEFGVFLKLRHPVGVLKEVHQRRQRPAVALAILLGYRTSSVMLAMRVVECRTVGCVLMMLVMIMMMTVVMASSSQSSGACYIQGDVRRRRGLLTWSGLRLRR